MDIIQTYQPWSTPLLHTKLPPEILNNLIQLTDEIAEDDNRESYNEQLAGEIENEWKIEPNRLNDIGFTDYAIQLSWEYFNKVVSNYHIINDEIPQSLVVFKNALDNIAIFSSWFNDQSEHEYNPMHVHQGTLFTGLSSVMILKLPESFGVEYSSDHQPQNGRLQILGSASGQFATIDYQPELKARDFYVFPYDMRHTVYPFNGPGTRRSLAANMDVKYDPIINRGRN